MTGMTIDYIVDYVMNSPMNTNRQILTDLLESLDIEVENKRYSVEEIANYVMNSSYNTNKAILIDMIESINKDDGGGEDEGIILFNGPIAKTITAELNYIDSDVFTDHGDKIKIIATGLKIDEDEPINFTKNFIFDYILNNGHTDPIININNKYYMRFDEYAENNYTRLEISDLDPTTVINSSFSCDNFKMILLQN